jgi:hypothetical protein
VRKLNVRQRVALSLGVVAVALTVGVAVEQHLWGPRGGWFGYAPGGAPFLDIRPSGDAVFATAWWLLVIGAATAVVIRILRDPPD